LDYNRWSRLKTNMGYALSDVLADRHRRLRQALVDRQLEAVIVTYLPNIFYLTNFVGSSAIVLLTAENLYFITDFRYVTAVEASWASPSGCPSASLVRVETTYDETLVGVLRSAGLRRVGFEAARVPFAQYGRWVSGLGFPVPGPAVVGSRSEAAPDDSDRARMLVPTERLVEAERVRKDAHEVATLRYAAGMLTGAFERILAEVQPGRTERQVGARIDWIMKDCGFDRSAFETIVASGPNAALPHARPGTRALSAGDLVVLDFGGVYDGYCVDLTRTVSLGEPDADARRVYGVVVEAHAAGVAASRAGATARDIDRAARGTLERRGLGEAFGHGTGHGLGIEVHEEPWLQRTRPAPAEPAAQAGTPAEVVIESGMVFTIEPGAYLPGWGGVRLEDDLLVTPDGPELLTHVPRDLAIT
jgi:Xaa-Pro aminopeptidase